MPFSELTKAVCLGCGHVTEDTTSLEILNDLANGVCGECGVHDVLWMKADGTRSITQDLSEDQEGGTTWFAIYPEYNHEVAETFKGRVRAPHKPPREGWEYPTMTLGQFRTVTALLPGDTYVTAYDDERDYVNLRVTQEDVDAMKPEDGQPSLILTITGETDTRQW